MHDARRFLLARGKLLLRQAWPLSNSFMGSAIPPLDRLSVQPRRPSPLDVSHPVEIHIAHAIGPVAASPSCLIPRSASRHLGTPCPLEIPHPEGGVECRIQIVGAVGADDPGFRIALWRG